MALCSLKHVSFTYHGSTQKMLSQIDAEIQEGDFILLCGKSGCGKTTLLRQLKKELTPYGKKEGTILFENKALSSLNEIESASNIGYIMQNPDDQIVTDQVWHELVFGMENIGMPPITMKRRVAEMCTFFGIQHLYHRTCDTLSGGQKQLVNLASILMMRPKLLIFDEPCAQLDPMAAREFLAILKRLNEEFGMTILLSEHRLEEIFPLVNRVWFLEEHTLRCDTTPRLFAASLSSIDPHHSYISALPCTIQLHLQYPLSDTCPITIKEGQAFLQNHFHPSTITFPRQQSNQELTLVMKHVYFRYQKEQEDILKDCRLSLARQEICALLGHNGAGKSTLLQLLVQHLSPIRGSITYAKKKASIAYIPQNPTTLFVKDEVYQDVISYADDLERVQTLLEEFELTPLLHQHPYDLSGGEQQRLALCKVLSKPCDFLFLDEPTKGLDDASKKQLTTYLKRCAKQGITILLATHDVEFAAQYCTSCALLFDGQIIVKEETSTFMKDNDFYTTSAARMAHYIYPNAVTIKDVMTACKDNQK